MTVDRPNPVWVSDITHVSTREEFMYLFLIVDPYSRKIVGYSARRTLEASGAVHALSLFETRRKNDTSRRCKTPLRTSR